MKTKSESYQMLYAKQSYQMPCAKQSYQMLYAKHFTHLTRSATWVINAEMDAASGTVYWLSTSSANFASRAGAEFDTFSTATL